MDLKQYRARIANQGIEQNVKAGIRERLMNSGEYETPRSVSKPVDATEVHRQLNALKHHYNNTIKQLNKIYPNVEMTYVDTSPESKNDSDPETGVTGGSFVGKKVVRRTLKKVRKIPEEIQNIVQTDSDSESESDEEGEPAVQGGKMHFVKSMKSFGKDFGTALKKAGINEASKVIAQEGVKFAKNNIGKLMTSAEEVLPEALPVAEEVAPMALMAAGMKKPKRTRKVSDKEKRRHALVRQLMEKHQCTLAAASRHIKEKNLQY